MTPYLKSPHGSTFLFLGSLWFLPTRPRALSGQGLRLTIFCKSRNRHKATPTAGPWKASVNPWRLSEPAQARVGVVKKPASGLRRGSAVSLRARPTLGPGVTPGCSLHQPPPPTPQHQASLPPLRWGPARPSPPENLSNPPSRKSSPPSPPPCQPHHPTDKQLRDRGSSQGSGSTALACGIAAPRSPRNGRLGVFGCSP